MSAQAELRDKLQSLVQRQAGSIARCRKVTWQDIAEAVSDRTGIPVGQLSGSERQRLLHLEQELRETVVGQDRAVEAVARASPPGPFRPGRPAEAHCIAALYRPVQAWAKRN